MFVSFKSIDGDIHCVPIKNVEIHFINSEKEYVVKVSDYQDRKEYVINQEEFERLFNILVHLQ